MKLSLSTGVAFRMSRAFQTGGGDIQADAEAGKAVDDLTGAALAVVVFEQGTP